MLEILNLKMFNFMIKKLHERNINTLTDGILNLKYSAFH